jgi:hypothetical protein
MRRLRSQDSTDNQQHTSRSRHSSRRTTHTDMQTCTSQNLHTLASTRCRCTVCMTSHCDRRLRFELQLMSTALRCCPLQSQQRTCFPGCTRPVARFLCPQCHRTTAFHTTSCHAGMWSHTVPSTDSTNSLQEERCDWKPNIGHRLSRSHMDNMDLQGHIDQSWSIECSSCR